MMVDQIADQDHQFHLFFGSFLRYLPDEITVSVYVANSQYLHKNHLLRRIYKRYVSNFAVVAKLYIVLSIHKSSLWTVRLS